MMNPNKLSVIFLLALLNYWSGFLDALPPRHWRQAVEIANDIFRQRNNVLEIYEVKMNLEHMLDHLREVMTLEAEDDDWKLTFPVDSTQPDRELIKHALDVQRLGQISDRNCLDPIPGFDDYLDLYEKIQKRRLEENPRVLRFVDQYFNLQLNLCKSLLRDHFAERVDDVKAQSPKAELFVLNLIDDVDSNHNRDSDGYLQDLLVRFLPNFYTPNQIRADLTKDGGLATRITSFKKECTRYVMNPFGVIAKTHMFTADYKDLNAAMNYEYYIWVRANDLCKLFEPKTGKIWAEATYHLLSSLLNVKGNASPSVAASSSRKRPIMATDPREDEDSKRRQAHRRDRLGPTFRNTSRHSWLQAHDPHYKDKKGTSNKGKQISNDSAYRQSDIRHYLGTEVVRTGNSIVSVDPDVEPLRTISTNFQPIIEFPDPVEEAFQRHRERVAKLTNDLERKINEHRKP